MTNQEAFTKVRKNLLKQNKKAIDADGDNVFVAPDGCRCALGGLMVDLTYEKCMELCKALNGEEGGVRMVKYRNDFISDNNLNGALMDDLEYLHDETEPETWPKGLEAIEKSYDFLS